MKTGRSRRKQFGALLTLEHREIAVLSVDTSVRL